MRAAWCRAWRTAPGEAEQATEALSERGAFLGLALSGGVVLSLMVASGLPLATALAILVLLPAALIAMTRIRAESRGPLLDLIGTLTPTLNLTRLAGTRAFSTRDLTAMSLHQWYADFGFNQPMPYGLEALKMADESRRAQRRFFLAAIAAALMGMVGTLAVEMHYAYGLGGRRPSSIRAAGTRPGRGAV